MDWNYINGLELRKNERYEKKKVCSKRICNYA